MSSIEYHLREFKIALDGNDPRRCLPEVLDTDRLILDIGCGIGQSMLALDAADRIWVGIDIDEDAIKYGLEHHGNRIQFILSDASRIPLPAQVVDLAFSRVALPYTNIPKVIREIRRVLRRGGRVWMTLHSKRLVKTRLRQAISARDVKSFLHGFYVLLNGYSLKYLGFVFPYLSGCYESWQDSTSVAKLLLRNGFKVTTASCHTFLLVEAYLESHETDEVGRDLS